MSLQSVRHHLVALLTENALYLQVELKAMREAAQWRRLQGLACSDNCYITCDMHLKLESVMMVALGIPID